LVAAAWRLITNCITRWSSVCRTSSAVLYLPCLTSPASSRITFACPLSSAIPSCTSASELPLDSSDTGNRHLPSTFTTTAGASPGSASVTVARSPAGSIVSVAAASRSSPAAAMASGSSVSGIDACLPNAPIALAFSSARADARSIMPSVIFCSVAFAACSTPRIRLASPASIESARTRRAPLGVD
jgi:hypothetical protein